MPNLRRILQRPPMPVWCVVFLVPFVGFSMLAHRTLPMFEVAENWAADWIANVADEGRPQHPDIVILSVTEQTLARFPFRQPIDRTFLAGVLRTLATRNVRAIGLDILFDQPTREEDDALFRSTALELKVPLVAGWSDTAGILTAQQYAFQRQFLEGIKAGYVNLSKDGADGTVRTAFPGRRHESGEWRDSFAGAIAAALGKQPPLEPFRIDYLAGPDASTSPFRTFPIDALGALPPTWLEGKVVLVGADLPLDDRHRTPIATIVGNEAGTVPGVQIHAQVLAQLLDERPAKQDSLAAEFVVVLALGLIALWIAGWVPGTALQLVSAVTVIACLWAGAVQVHARADMTQPIITPSVGFAIGLFAAVSFIGHRRRLQGQFIRAAFSRYVSPTLVKKLEENPEHLAVGGEKREISVLFTDIEGFTSFAEKVDATVVIGYLNRYLEAMCAEVERHEGMIDKFIGDAVMAVFGAPNPQPDHAERALRTAVAMGEASRRFAAELARDGVAFGRTRIGVHSGAAVIGNVGGSRRFEYTAIGDVVNTASRLEGANRFFGTEICFSDATRLLAPGMAARPIGGLVLKGRTTELPVFTPVIGEADERTQSYLAAYELLERGSPEALNAFEAHLEKYPDDDLARFHRNRLAAGDVSVRIVLEGK